ncbi:MAG: CotH kinase family protein [Flavobacteriales bacterium]|nr:CotH kinase family protein [Flavobacteriales bacterium]
MLKKKLFLALALLGSALSPFSQVIINEFSFANYSDWAQAGGWDPIYEDWIEFYNPGGAAFSLEGYWLSDNALNPQKWEIPAGVSVPAGGYLTYLCTGTGEFDPNFLGFNNRNTNFKLTQTDGEELVFSNPLGTVLESYDFDALTPNQANHSYARVPNGSSTWVIHTDPSPDAANVGGTSGTSYAATPQFNTEAGYYSAAISVSISTTEAGATIYYTLDGSLPGLGDAVYGGPININTSTVIKAIVFSSTPGVLPSFTETNTYLLGADQHSLPVYAISGPTLSDGAWGGNEVTCIEVFAADGTFVTQADGDSNEHGNDSNAYDQRGFDMIVRDAMGYDNEVAFPVFHHSDRVGYERLIFKAAANDNYPYSNGGHVRDAYCHELSILGDLKLDERTTEYCILYINAEYWGVYDVREKVDDIDFTEHYYDQPEGFVDFIKTWGGTWAEYGSQNDWNDLVNFITTNDMTVQANYDYVLTQYNTISLIDYFILNGYVVCADWLNWNTAWWRGRHPDGEAKRWKYVLWDLDNTFGHGANYTGIPNTGSGADPCNPENLGDPGGQGHVPVLNALFDNEDFFYDYVNRYASLSNTIFSCESMIGVLDSMINVIQPEMQRQVDRWGGNFAQWEANVQDIRDFINERCSDEIIGGLEDCYDITALTLTVYIEGVGEIEVSSVPLDQFDANINDPWSGIFWADVPIDLGLLSGECGSFAGWEIISGDGVLEDPNDPNTTLTITTDVTLQATFVVSSESVTVMTDVFPAGAGVITLNGTEQVLYPFTNTVDLGSSHMLSVTENEWFEFDHWETLNTSLNPNEDLMEVNFQSCLSDTIIAIFNELPHFTLCVEVQPAGAGTITMNGVALVVPMCETFAGDVNYNFSTIPSDMWSEFLHWQLNNNILTPDEFNTSISFILGANDTLIAVYNVYEHRTITVMVDPPYSGVVTFGDGMSTDYSASVEVAVGEVMPFTATPNPYWNFVKWEAENNTPSPNNLDKQVTFVVQNADVIIAHFEADPFGVYIPNSFSPNGDGVNDIFIPQGTAIDPDYYTLRIFNRWGEKVFESMDINKPWDGSHLGGEYFVQDEVYIYFLELRSIFDATYKEYTGQIFVFR